MSLVPQIKTFSTLIPLNLLSILSQEELHQAVEEQWIRSKYSTLQHNSNRLNLIKNIKHNLINDLENMANQFIQQMNENVDLSSIRIEHRSSVITIEDSQMLDYVIEVKYNVKQMTSSNLQKITKAINQHLIRECLKEKYYAQLCFIHKGINDLANILRHYCIEYGITEFNYDPCKISHSEVKYFLDLQINEHLTEDEGLIVRKTIEVLHDCQNEGQILLNDFDLPICSYDDFFHKFVASRELNITDRIYQRLIDEYKKLTSITNFSLHNSKSYCGFSLSEWLQIINELFHHSDLIAITNLDDFKKNNSLVEFLALATKSDSEYI